MTPTKTSTSYRLRAGLSALALASGISACLVDEETAPREVRVTSEVRLETGVTRCLVDALLIECVDASGDHRSSVTTDPDAPEVVWELRGSVVTSQSLDPMSATVTPDSAAVVEHWLALWEEVGPHVKREIPSAAIGGMRKPDPCNDDNRLDECVNR